MLSPWRAELAWVSVALLTAVFFGKLFNQVGLAFAVCVFAYLWRHVLHIHRLLVWLRVGGELPQGGGIWEEIYYLIFRLRRRNKRRKKQLIKMVERFRTATAALPDATVLLGPRCEIDWFNDAAGRLLGLRRSDVGQQIGNLMRYPKFTQYLRDPDTQETVSIPSPISENNQLEIRIVPYGAGLRLLVAQDVTQLRFMERVRRDFVANVSHELRTPLTVLRGYVETLVDSADLLPERYTNVLRHMEEQTARMQNLVDGLLSLTRLESSALQGRQERVAVAALLKSICDEVRLVGDHLPIVDLIIESSADLIGSEQELRSGFSNLVVNAVKYTPASGQVTVFWRDDGAGARLDVVDTGPGIAEEHLPRLTERFYRVDVGVANVKAGSGLGLAIVKHVLVRHGAELRISSSLGHGSCFSCCFPPSRVIRPKMLVHANAS